MINAVSFSPSVVMSLSSAQLFSSVQSVAVQSSSVQSSAVQPARPAFEVLPQAKSLDALAVRLTESPAERLHTERDEPVVRHDAKEPPAASLSQGSSITSFRDHATGVLVIKLVGRRNNEVLAQFPTPMQLSNYPKISSFAAPSSSLREMA